MCEYCYKYPCPAGCPNAEGQKAKYTCYECSGDICEGDTCLEVVGACWCYDCLEGMNGVDMLYLVGHEWLLIEA